LIEKKVEAIMKNSTESKPFLRNIWLNKTLSIQRGVPT
jgi:hypothetical protein